MNEAAARAWVADRHGASAVDAVGYFLDMVVEENTRQNLIAPSTIDRIWSRHAVDSAQLLAFDRSGGTWLDIGSGGGFPGMIVALLRAAPVVLIEPRKRRAAFLQQCAAALGLRHVRVHPGKVEGWNEVADLISARAVATLDALFAGSGQCAGVHTRWILPKGRSARGDVEIARRAWRGVFHVEQSVVEADAGIVIAEGIVHR